MQEKHLYEYSVIRVLPRVEREEFINVGVILFSKAQQFLEIRYHLDIEKLKLFSDEIDTEQLQIYLEAFREICQGSQTGGPIGRFDIPSRFRWLTAERSAIIQTSRPHPGLSYNLAQTLKRLFQELVL